MALNFIMISCRQYSSTCKTRGHLVLISFDMEVNDEVVQDEEYLHEVKLALQDDTKENALKNEDELSQFISNPSRLTCWEQQNLELHSAELLLLQYQSLLNTLLYCSQCDYRTREGREKLRSHVRVNHR